MSAETTPRDRVIAASFAALLLVVAAYANFFRNSFHFDDDHVIVENASIRSLANWPRFFTDAHTFSSLPSNATYRPLVTLSFALDYAARHSLDPVPFHTTQLLLLIATAILLAILYTHLFGRGYVLLAITAAAIFCVHTANTETMNFLSSRSELISAIGFLGAFAIFIRWPKRRKQLLYLIPLAIGALAKAPVVIFAGVVIAWVILIERKRWTDAVRAAVPSFVTGVVLLIALSRMNAPEWISGGGSRGAYFMTQPYIWLHYARLSLLPAGLSADTDLDLLSHWYDTNAIAGYLFIIFLCIGIARLARTRELAPIAFGLSWFAITLLPTSSIFPLAEVANEHRLFFPLMGIAPCAVWSAELIARRKPEWRRYAMASILIVAVALAYGTRVRNRAWLTEESLWHDVTEKSPRNGRGWMNYGLTQMEAGRFTDAKSSFDRAEQFTPNYSTLEINRGIVASALGQQEEAERFFRRALELQDDRNGHFYYARWLLERGRGLEAERHLAGSARLAPSWMPPRKMALDVAVARGDVARSASLTASIRAINPAETIAPPCDSYATCFDQGWKATLAKRHLEAAVAYRAAVKYSPRATAYNDIGWELQSLGFADDAASAYKMAIEVDPSFTRARNNLASLR
jgi:tetratricopeptide (TPR) repeat protein